MISRYRMKIDTLGQTILFLALGILAFLSSGMQWTWTMLIILSIWQIASALHLLFAYRYINKLNYLKTSLVIGLSLPIWVHSIGNLAYLPVLGLVGWYFIQTIKDTIKVYNRPRSFWDLS